MSEAVRQRSLFFWIKWWKIGLIMAVPLYIFGAQRNAQITAGQLESVAKGFHGVSANCVTRIEDAAEKIVTVLDCGGAYDRIIEERDEIVHSRGCWNAAAWKVVKQGRDTVTSTTIDVWCAVPRVF